MKNNYLKIFSCLFIIYFCTSCTFYKHQIKQNQNLNGYEKWFFIGKIAADESLKILKNINSNISNKNIIVMTNAGYAEINGDETRGILDGIAIVTKVSRGNNTLVEVHSGSWIPLWIAVYEKESGFCAYLELKNNFNFSLDPNQMFSTEIEQINANHLFKNAKSYQVKIKNKFFGGNAFRIITMANAISKGVPQFVVRSFEFHDHYCPGVTSGILIAQYLKKHFPPGKRGYFIHSVIPWCKEDALLVMLNATPGKKNYAISYPDENDKKKIVKKAQNAATIVYRKNDTDQWEGLLLGFKWAENICTESGSKIIDKLCSDLWYLDYIDQPEKFVEPIKSFTLPKDVSPSEWARPGKDPLKMLGLTMK